MHSLAQRSVSQPRPRPLLASVRRRVLDGLLKVVELSPPKVKPGTQTLDDYGIYVDCVNQRWVALGERAALIVRDPELDRSFGQSFVLAHATCQSILERAVRGSLFIKLRVLSRGPNNFRLWIEPAPLSCQETTVSYKTIDYLSRFPKPNGAPAKLNPFLQQSMYFAMCTVAGDDELRVDVEYNGQGPAALYSRREEMLGSMQPNESLDSKAQLHRTMAGVGL